MKKITLLLLAMLALTIGVYAQERIHIVSVQDSTERTPFSTVSADVGGAHHKMTRLTGCTTIGPTREQSETTFTPYKNLRFGIGPTLILSRPRL